MTLTEFLLARLAEDEAVAQRLANGGGDLFIGSSGWGDVPDAVLEDYDAARVLADVEAKRRIVEAFARVDADEAGADAEMGFGLFFAVQHLASVHRDHPDWREEWA